MPDEGDVGFVGLEGGFEEDPVNGELVLGGFDEVVGDGPRHGGWPEGQAAGAPAVMVLQKVLVPAVAGQLPEVGETVAAVVEGRLDEGGHGAIRPPEQAADVAVAGVVDELERVGGPFEGVVEADGRAQADARPLEDRFDELLRPKNLLPLLVRRDGPAAQGVVAEELVAPCVGGDLEERVGEQLLVLLHIGLQRAAGDEERRGHLKPPVHGHDPAAGGQAGGRFRVVGGDIARGGIGGCIACGIGGVYTGLRQVGGDGRGRRGADEVSSRYLHC